VTYINRIAKHFRKAPERAAPAPQSASR
jgi:hypothetical protein